MNTKYNVEIILVLGSHKIEQKIQFAYTPLPHTCTFKISHDSGTLVTIDELTLIQHHRPKLIVLSEFTLRVIHFMDFDEGALEGPKQAFVCKNFLLQIPYINGII